MARSESDNVTSSKRHIHNGRRKCRDRRSYVVWGGSRAHSCSSGIVRRLGAWSISGCCAEVRWLNLWGNLITGCEWRAETLLFAVWRRHVVQLECTWRIVSLGDFSALSIRSVGRYAGKTSWSIVITYFHLYLRWWSTLAYFGDLNVRGLNFEVAKIPK